jgi:hypothetical protein
MAPVSINVEQRVYRGKIDSPKTGRRIVAISKQLHGIPFRKPGDSAGKRQLQAQDNQPKAQEGQNEELVSPIKMRCNPSGNTSVT